ncbi:hypothetical protein LJC13_00770 [Peptostreptococcaceae bacterium OttesenSCG-928-C18]|nr:hypothetical protein [Peptostreptococcaceae bacterium OttesenSCG-928-C18]
MGVLPTSYINVYNVKFTDGYAQQLYAIQGETGRKYEFIPEDINLDDKKDGIGMRMVISVKDKEVGMIEAEKNEDSTGYVIKIPQNMLLESDKNAKYQLFIGYVGKDEELYEVVGTVAGDFVIYPNINFESKDVASLLVDLREVMVTMEAVLNLGDNLELPAKVVEEAQEIKKLLDEITDMYNDSDLENINKRFDTLTEKIVRLESYIQNYDEKIKELKEESVREIVNTVGENGGYIIYSNGFCKLYIRKNIYTAIDKASVNTDNGTTLYMADKFIEFPIKFKTPPFTTVLKAKYRTSNSWGTTGNTSAEGTKQVEIRILNNHKGEIEHPTAIELVVEGMVDLNDYQVANE